MLTKQLIKILRNISRILEMKGENPFKSRAYSNAADVIEDQNIDIEKALKENRLGDIKGVGKALQQKITEFVEHGTMSYYDKLTEEIPESLVQLTKIAYVGPKKAMMLNEKLGIRNIDQLEKAAEEGKLAKLKGFTAKSQELVLNSIYHMKASRGRMLQEDAREFVRFIRDKIAASDGVELVEIAGDYRRKSETISDIPILYSAGDDILDEKVINSIKDTAEVGRLKKSGFHLEFIRSKKQDFQFLLHRLTGSEEYFSAIADHANEMGYEIKSNYLHKNGSRINIALEEDIFKELGLQYIPPELRESSKAVEAARNNKIPKLIDHSDLRGMIHCHSDWSDGKNTIREMALRSKELGFEYFAICDHSQTASYAGGLTVDDIYRQHEEIDKLNDEGIGIPILKGIESDILADGSLDYEPEVLEKFDMVVASVHSHFNMPKEEMTRRIICALQSPYTTMLGHPTGRMLLVRPPYKLDIKAVIDAAVENDKIIEINANPYRLDLSWENVIYGKEKGLKISINPDSHKVDTLTDVRYGINIARKGWLEASDVVNTLNYEDFMKNVIRK